MNTPLRGYVALLTALLMASALSLLVFSQGASAIHARSSQADRENMRRAHILAQSCAQVALRMYAQNPNFQPSSSEASIEVAPGATCSIDSLATTSAEIIVRSHAQVQQSTRAIETRAALPTAVHPFAVSSEQDL